jgi:TPR repeat protein
MNANKLAYENALGLYNAGSYRDSLEAFLRLSTDGHAKSSFYAGSIYLKGGDGILRNEVRARELYALALEQEFLPGAALSIALMEYQGNGGERDYKSSMRHYLMVKGNPFAKIMIGLMIQYGYGCEKDESAALRWFEGAWSLGHPLGLKQAAYIYMRRGRFIRGIIDYLRSTLMLVWFYGIRKISILKSPNEVLGLGWRRH